MARTDVASVKAYHGKALKQFVYIGNPEQSSSSCAKDWKLSAGGHRDDTRRIEACVYAARLHPVRLVPSLTLLLT
jgi:hypothetical protein